MFQPLKTADKAAIGLFNLPRILYDGNKGIEWKLSIEREQGFIQRICQGGNKMDAPEF